MSEYTALLDANVLYPAPMRDLLMQVAATRLFKAKWSADIHREWIEALIRNEPDRDRQALERTRDLMNRAVRDCLVTGYEALIPTLTLPDAGDRHVLAAAIVGRCDVIVTQNLKALPCGRARAARDRGAASGRVSVQSAEPCARPVLQRRGEGARPPQESALRGR